MRTGLRDAAPGFLATAAALLWLIVRDGAGRHPWVGLFLFGGAAFGLLGFLLLDLAGAVGSTGKLTAARLRRVAALVVSAPLVVLAVLAVGFSPARAPGVLAIGVVVAAAAAFAIDRLAPRLGAPDTPRFWFGAVVAAIQLLGLFVYVHIAEGTLADVRPGTEPLHQALFFGTWLVSLALLVPWAGRIAGRAAVALPSRWWWGWTAGAALVGFAALEADRRAMVGLYPGVHLWLQCLGVLSLDAALGRFVAADRLQAWRVSERRLVALRRAGVAALAAIVVGATGFAAVALGGFVTDRGIRAEISETSVGPLLLRMARGGGSVPVAEVALTYERYHDVAAPANDWNIILLSVDAFRGDFVPDPDEPDKSGAPRLAELASTCADFRRAYAPGSRTAIGMGALMIGRYSAHIVWELWYWTGRLIDPNAKDSPTVDADLQYTTIPKIPPEGNLAQRMQAAGLRTMATPWDNFSKFFRKGSGFEVGFEDYTDVGKFLWPEPASPNVLAAALQQIERARGKRFFQWIHLFDPHESKGDRARYAELVQAMDAAIGDFVDELGRRGLRDKTALVLLADHGEALGDHRNGTHGTSLYEEQVRVPMFICLPGRGGQVFRRPVSTIDAVATMLALAGADLRGVDGVNLLPLIDGGRDPERRPVFTELHRYQSRAAERTVDMQAVILDEWKLIRDLKEDTIKLFNLRDDPREERNAVAAEPAVAAELEGMLDALMRERTEPEPPRPLFSARPAVFDVSETSALLWARTTLPAQVHFEIATRREFTDARTTPQVEVDGETDLVHVAEVGDLAPGKRYHYRAVLTHEGERLLGDVGTFMTASTAPRPVRIAWSADLMADQAPFRIFDAIRRERPNLFLLLGDTMYADIPKKNQAQDLKGFRTRHTAIRRDSSLQAFLASTATAAIWDDHEIVNNAHRKTRSLDVARRVFREQWPVRSADDAGEGLYRSLRPAPQVEVFILDLRSFRDPPGRRETMLGAEQKEWFIQSFQASTARTKIVVSSVPFLPTLGDDGWSGFPAERDELRGLLANERPGSVIVLSGDLHMAWHVVDPDTNLHEFQAGPLAAWTFAAVQPDRVREVEGSGRFAVTNAPSFGVLDVTPQGDVTVRFLDSRGKEQHRVTFGGDGEAPVEGEPAAGKAPAGKGPAGKGPAAGKLPT